MPKEQFQKAKNNKNDEYYTLYNDIENEIQHYWSQLKGKRIWCNCDDPEWSNFYLYFQNQIKRHNLNVKFTSYRLVPENFTGYTLQKMGRTITKKEGGPNTIVETDEAWVDADGYCEGDFRAKAQEELWQWADVIITNPPFSLFREFIDYIMDYGKQFLIIGNMNAISYKEIFQLIKAGKLWLGHNTLYNFENIQGTLSGAPALWYTNLDTKVRHHELILPEWEDGKYPKYENYDAYETSWLNGIPKKGRAQIPFTNKVLGVPITFLLKFNPNQFEIVGCAPTDFEATRKIKTQQLHGKLQGSITTNCKKNVFIKVAEQHATYQNIETGEYYAAPYARLLVKLTDKYYKKYREEYENEN